MAELWVPGQDSRSLDSRVHDALKLGSTKPSEDDPSIDEMRLNRKVASRNTPDVQIATQRPKDPLWYWKQNQLPYDVYDPDELVKIREYCRGLALTHPVVGACIDVFSQYPVIGIELSCKDQRITDFYTELFFDQLDYEDFVVDIGREYWTVGEAWPFGSFNELLGVWEDEELLNPDDINVLNSPFSKDPWFEMLLPASLREIFQTKEPRWEYLRLRESYPELEHYATSEEAMPVSNILLRQIKRKGDSFNPRGVPLLMRAMRHLIQEEMLNSAMDAVASRLYTPLILAKLGASATELGTQTPWIPTADDISDFNQSLDIALSSDFRVLTHHFAVNMSVPLGRETVPRFDQDFERIEEKILQVFGLSKTMLSGGSANQTYAADALNRDLVTQLLTRYQRHLSKHFDQRARVVAEAQGHYDFEVKGGQRYQIMEEVLEVDEETGKETVVEQPKLLVPEMHFKPMSLQEDKNFRQLIEALVQQGVPISQKTRLVNIDIDLDEEIEQVREQQVTAAVAAQEVRRDTYMRLKSLGLPIPEDLVADFTPQANGSNVGVATDPMTEPGEQMLPSIGTSEPAPDAALSPDAADLATVLKLPRNRGLEQMPAEEVEQRQRPIESDEMRADMPRAMQGIRGPSHIGARRYAKVKKGQPLPEEDPVSLSGMR